jgi:hypothetical protein
LVQSGILKQTPFVTYQEEAVSVIAPEVVTRLVISQANKGSLTAQKCLNLTQQGFNFIQDASVINLNQPADCFQLIFGKPFSVANLPVKSLATMTQKVSVINFPQTLATLNWSLVPLRSASSVLPNTVWGAVLTSAPIFKKRLVRLNRQFSRNIQSDLSLCQFQVLRC